MSTVTAPQACGDHVSPTLVHPERARVSACGANERESKDPDKVSSAMRFQGVLSKISELKLQDAKNYRFACPLAIFFTFGFFDPRG
jgi:hypothetical protein